MGALIIVIGIGYILYNLIKEGLEPTNTHYTDWDKYNKDAMSGKYSAKQLGKMAEQGKYNTDKCPWK